MAERPDRRLVRRSPSSSARSFVWRCTWHRSPIFDLSLFRVRTFSVGELADGDRRRRLLRLHPDQRAVPHRCVALLGPAGGLRDDRRPGRRCRRGRPLQPAGTADRPSARARRRWAALGRRVDVVRGADDRDARLSRGVAARHGPARDRRGRVLPEPQRRRRRVGPGEQLRDGDRDELRCPAGRSSARRRAGRRDPRRSLAGRRR